MSSTTHTAPGVETSTVIGDAASPRLELQVIRDASAFAGLRDEWNALVLQSSATVYQTHEWASAWWEHFASHSIAFSSGRRAASSASFRSTRNV